MDNIFLPIFNKVSLSTRMAIYKLRKYEQLCFFKVSSLTLSIE